jgi:hypothetical protein
MDLEGETIPGGGQKAPPPGEPLFFSLRVARG